MEPIIGSKSTIAEAVIQAVDAGMTLYITGVQFNGTAGSNVAILTLGTTQVLVASMTAEVPTYSSEFAKPIFTAQGEDLSLTLANATEVDYVITGYLDVP